MTPDALVENAFRKGPPQCAVHKVCCLLQGVFLGGVEGLSWLLLVAAFITQVQQLMKNVRL